MKLTPAMQQYVKVKEEHPDCIVMFRMGDFYEMFYEDAKTSAQVLGITLTSRGKGETKAPLAGIPYHALDQYLKKLVQKGYRVALVEQLEDPKKAKGLVKRGVVRIITPGTIIEDSILTKESNNYIASISKNINEKNKKVSYGISFCDVSTGEFSTTICDSKLKLFAELERFHPSEIVLPVSFETNDKSLVEEIDRRGFVITYHDDRFYWKEKSESVIKKHFGVKNLEGFGFINREVCITSSGSLLSYLLQTQMNDLKSVNKIHTYSIEEYMILDSPTQRNLELLRNIRDNTSRGTVFDVINNTHTSMGARKLKNWLLRPLRDVKLIQNRLDAVDDLIEQAILREDLKDLMDEISDIERIIGRVTYRSANPRDMVSLRNTLEQLPKIKKLLDNSGSNFLQQLKEYDNIDDLFGLLDSSIKDEPPVTIREGNIIKKGYNSELDELRKISSGGKEWILEFEAKEKEKTGIKNLRVKYNKVFGYFIEVTKSNLSLVPDTYIRKQTQVNCERFIVEELKEKEQILLGAQDKINTLEYDLFMNILEEVAKKTELIQDIASRIASLDCIISLCQTAINNHYTKPIVNDEPEIVIVGGRHPVVERIESGSFVSNDIRINNKSLMHVITGPNMSGKSTYLRQVALITLLAQIGSFIPATQGKIGIVDRIFSRVGAYDDLSMGQSTFMVEMAETANILNNATSKSLIIMDEVGRGTSTYDGLSLAWAIIEYLLDEIGAKTLFATHYHHLNKLETKHPNVRNFNILVEENKDEVVFLHKIVEGGTDKSYGIHVAKIAGVPKKVINRSQVIMGRIEDQEQLTNTIVDDSEPSPEISEIPPLPRESKKEIKKQETKEETNQTTLSDLF